MQMVLRSAALYFFVWLVTRTMGRKELSQLSSFDLILLIVFAKRHDLRMTEERGVVDGHRDADRDHSPALMGQQGIDLDTGGVECDHRRRR